MVVPAFFLGASVVVMSCLRSNWCSTIFGLLICCSVEGAGFKEYEAKFSSSQGKLRVKIEGGSYYLKNGVEWGFLKSFETFGGVAIPVIFMDANKDGYTDVFVKVYDGRVEGFYTLFLVRPSGNNLAISE